MINLGKKFEENFKSSVPSCFWINRYKDSASSYYGGNSQLRFSISNIADYEIYDGKNLFLIELKNHKGNSIPLNCIRGEKNSKGKYKKQNQIDELTESNKFNGISSCIIVFFCEKEKCFYLNIDDFNYFCEFENRQSIPMSYFEEKGIEIEVNKLKTNYRFNIYKWINNFEK